MSIKPEANNAFLEVGDIPHGWEIVQLGEIGVFQKGKGIRRDEALSGSIPCIRYGELYTHHENVIKEFNSWISEEISASSKRIKQGDILFAGSGETKEDIGKCASFVDDIEAYAGGDIVIFSPRREDPIFLGYLLNAPTIQKQKAQRAQGDAVVHISASALSSIHLPLPKSIAEQKAIATALSDMDALISGLDQLIAKKRDIKQATMQQLLTGQTRLPGFSGEWEVKQLGEVLSVRHGKSQHFIEVSDGCYPILATGGEIGRTDTFIYDKPSVLIGRKGTIDKPVYREQPFWTVDTLFYTEISAVAKPKFIYYKFLMINWRAYNEASGVPSLNASTIEAVEIEIPCLAEQEAISAVLSDMDAELAALDIRRAKADELKQGMMQELLTGRIRLSVPAIDGM